MIKRELIDRNSLYVPSDENDYDELMQFADDVMSAEVITEQEIVKPYFLKLREQIIREFMDDSCMSQYTVYKIIGIIKKLSEDGEKNGKA